MVFFKRRFLLKMISCVLCARDYFSATKSTEITKGDRKRRKIAKRRK